MTLLVVALAAAVFAFVRYDLLLWRMDSEQRASFRRFGLMSLLAFMDSREPARLGDLAVTAGWWAGRVAFPLSVLVLIGSAVAT